MNPSARYLTIRALLDRLGGGVSRWTLYRWRLEGRGPDWISTPNRRILYPLENLEIWERSRIRRKP